jgi:hypothetical protein
VQGIYSRLVRLIDRGPYSHCELVFADGMSGSASYIDGGVRLKRIDYDSDHWDVVDLPANAQAEDYARSWFEFNQGAPYDLMGNVRFVLPWLSDSERGWFCSEAIAAERAGSGAAQRIPVAGTCRLFFAPGGSF